MLDIFFDILPTTKCGGAINTCWLTGILYFVPDVFKKKYLDNLSLSQPLCYFFATTNNHWLCQVALQYGMLCHYRLTLSPSLFTPVLVSIPSSLSLHKEFGSAFSQQIRPTFCYITFQQSEWQQSFLWPHSDLSMRKASLKYTAICCSKHCRKPSLSPWCECQVLNGFYTFLSSEWTNPVYTVQGSASHTIWRCHSNFVWAVPSDTNDISQQWHINGKFFFRKLLCFFVSLLREVTLNQMDVKVG